MTGTLEEHYAYLSLENRTRLYREALQPVVRPGDVVADLGCGFGVLGMLALEAGAARCYGVDQTDATEIARETMKRQGLDDRYTVIRGSTFATSLPEPVDLLVCDHIGYFGYDYDIIAVLDDARARLLRPGGRIVPGRLELAVAGVASAAGSAKANQWTDPAIPAPFHWLQGHALNMLHPVRIAAEEGLTAPETLLTIDFAQPAPESLAVDVQLTVTAAGQFNGLAGWFSAELAPGIGMTNSPFAPDAIDRSHVFLPCREPFAVEAGDTVGLRLVLRPDPQLVAWTITPPGGARPQSMSTWHSTILAPADLAHDGGRPLARNARGEARMAVLQLLDGNRSAAEVEAELLRTRSDLFASPVELRRFVARELRGNAE